MRRAAGLLGLMAAFAAGQTVTTYKDPSGNMELRQYEDFVVNLPTAGKLTFDVRKVPRSSRPVLGSWKAEAMQFAAARIVGAAAQAAPGKGPFELRSLTATGGATMTMRDPKTKQATTIRSARTDYRVGGGEGLVTLTGNVTITNNNPAKEQTLVATGSGGSARVNPRAKTAANGLRRATLRGPVRIDVQESGGDRFVATGSLLTLDNTTKPAQMTLSGNVKLVRSGKIGVVSGPLKSANITLNEKGEMTGVRMQGGS